MKKLFSILIGALLLTSCHKPEQKPVEGLPKASQQSKIAIATAKANTISTLQNTIDPVSGLSYFQLLDMLQVRVDTSLSAAITNSDWIDTSRHPVSVGGIIFAINGGISGNGTTGKIDTKYNSSTGINFTQNNNFYAVYIGNRIIENKADLSALGAGPSGNEIQCISVSPSIYTYNNGSTQHTTANDIGKGFHYVRRAASNLWTSGVGGYPSPYFTDASTAIANQDMWEYCRAVNTTYSKYTTRTHYYIAAGSGNIDPYKFNCIMEKYYLLPLGLCPTKRITFVGNSFVANRDFPQQTLAAINDYNNIDLNMEGVSGQTTEAMLTYSQANVFPFQKDYLTKDVYDVCELTNSMATNGGNATVTYNAMVAYCDSLRSRCPNAFIIVNTMLPRTGQVNRQNDANLNDTTTLNGMVRVKLVRDGHANTICDVASDMTIGQNGQNTNTTYYKTDHLHCNSTGNSIYKTYVSTSILLGL